MKAGSQSRDNDAGKGIGEVQVEIEVVERAKQVSQDLSGIWVLYKRKEMRTP